MPYRPHAASGEDPLHHGFGGLVHRQRVPSLAVKGLRGVRRRADAGLACHNRARDVGEGTLRSMPRTGGRRRALPGRKPRWWTRRYGSGSSPGDQLSQDCAQ
jgi:hypothetical protein